VLDLLDDIGIFWRGVVLGVIIAAPVGPIGLLCIRRSLERGLATGLATGLGAALADAFFSGIAAFGITAVIDMITANLPLLQVVGGIFLLIVAGHSLTREPKPLATEPVAGNLPAAAFSGLFLTATNPVTILGMRRWSSVSATPRVRSRMAPWWVASSWAPCSGGCSCAAVSPCCAAG
jgi:threonine/homoserine/homoserine lactone efflux protein